MCNVYRTYVFDVSIFCNACNVCMQPVYALIDLSTDLPLYILIYLSIYLSVYLSIYLFIYLYTYTSIHLYTYTSLYIYTPIRLYTYTSIHLYIYTIHLCQLCIYVSMNDLVPDLLPTPVVSHITPPPPPPNPGTPHPPKHPTLPNHPPKPPSHPPIPQPQPRGRGEATGARSCMYINIYTSTWSHISYYII